MTKQTRRQHSPQFKLDTAALVLDQGYTYAKASEAMGVDAGSIRRWVRQLKSERGGQTPSGSKALTPEQQKIQALQARVAELELEKTILKKASALLLSDDWKAGR